MLLFVSGLLDLSLIGWLLLFLSKCLDMTILNTTAMAAASMATADDDKQLGKDVPVPPSPSNRWDFLQGDAALHNSKSSAKTTSARLYRRKLQKRLMHHKQHLLDLQTAKKNFMSAQLEKSTAAGVSKEAEALLKQHEAVFKKQLKQYSSKVSRYFVHTLCLLVLAKGSNMCRTNICDFNIVANKILLWF